MTSPLIHEDGQVTFRVHAPNAREVSLGGSVTGTMRREAEGEWSLTVGPLPSNIYSYHVVIDGAAVADPTNRWCHNGSTSLFMVPAPADQPPMPWECTAIAHGSMHIDYYSSLAIPNVTRRCHVYTPPNYDPAEGDLYPTLYLLHGHGDNDESWMRTGRANFIFDNLNATGKAVPMVVVMPDGGSLDTMPTNLFVDDVLHNLIPFMERRYRLKIGVANRAVAGLSMGGGHAMHLALNHPGEFCAAGIWSSGWREWETTSMPDLLPRLADSSADFRSLHTVELVCGSDDRLLPVTEALDAWLTRCQIAHHTAITSGGHVWGVWRDALIKFSQQLFQ